MKLSVPTNFQRGQLPYDKLVITDNSLHFYDMTSASQQHTFFHKERRFENICIMKMKVKWHTKLLNTKTVVVWAQKTLATPSSLSNSISLHKTQVMCPLT